jgi:hypothetical protein
MRILSFKDPQSIQTARAALDHNHERTGQSGHHYNFPWASGVLATIYARQDQADLAWGILQETRPTICLFGGMTEVMEGTEWNMQYFCTAQAAVVTALHNLLLQGEDSRVAIFPALPSDWQECSFENLLAEGLEVSAAYRLGQVSGSVRNITPQELASTLVWKYKTAKILLKPGETYDFSWKQ